MSIDWSKAPEGATHWHDKYGVFAAGWVKTSDAGVRYFWNCRYGDKWAPDPSPLPLTECIARPDVAWNGQGLPPVGTVCEVEDSQSGRWCECLILAWDAELAVFSAGGEYPYQYDGSPAGSFRPIRTAKQIAEEQWQQEVDNLVEDLGPLCTMRPIQIAEWLHARGYRKQVKP